MITAPVASVLCRDAAVRIRKLAEAATPGPWRRHDTHLGAIGGHTATVLAGEGFDFTLLAWLPTFSQEPWDEPRNVWANAEHIAAWSPTQALAVADVLEQAAVHLDALPAGVPLPVLLSLLARLAESIGGDA